MEENLWLASIVFVLLGSLFSFRVTTHRPRSPDPANEERCSQCRYSLVGLPQDAVCPECGCSAPRLRLEVTRYKIALRDNGMPGLPIMALITIVMAVLQPVTWWLFHQESDPLCPIWFDRLDDEPLTATLILYLCCAGGYLPSLLFARRRWLVWACMLGLAAGLGQHVGLSVSATDHYGWHRALMRQMLIGGLTLTAVAEVALMSSSLSRRKPLLKNGAAG